MSANRKNRNPTPKDTENRNNAKTMEKLEQCQLGIFRDLKMKHLWY
jgi:hypothetical protein